MTEQIPREWLLSRPKNILKLEHPENYTCVVEQCQAGHPALSLKIYSGDRDSAPGHLEARFSGIKFFSGPLEWRGANLCVSPHEEWNQLVQQLGWLEGVPEAITREYEQELRLFTIQADKPAYQIRFVAANLHVSHH